MPSDPFDEAELIREMHTEEEFPGGEPEDDDTLDDESREAFWHAMDKED